MYSKALFLLLAFSVAVAMVTAYDENAELFQQFMDEQMVAKRGRRKGGKAGANKGESEWRRKYLD